MYCAADNAEMQEEAVVYAGITLIGTHYGRLGHETIEGIVKDSLF